MSGMEFTRQLDFVTPEDLRIPVTLIGLGGINSIVAWTLAKMGCSIMAAYEFDGLEAHNLPNQFYRIGDIDRFKGDALIEIIRDFCGVELKIIPEEFTGQHELEGIVISGVDKMTPRHTIWKSVKFKPSVQLYIDARMGGQVANIYTINTCDPDDIRFYESKLWDEDEAHELRCTNRAIIYTVNMIAGLVANQVKKFVKGESLIRELVWDAQNMILMKEQSGSYVSS